MRQRTIPRLVPSNRRSACTVELTYVRTGNPYWKPTPGTYYLYAGDAPNGATWTESMTDGTGGGLLPCIHERRELTLAGGALKGFRENITSGIKWWSATYTWDNICGFPEDIVYSGITGVGLFDTTVPAYAFKWQLDWESRYSSTAVEQMMPRVRQLMSVPLFLWEAEEWKHDKVKDQFNKIINQVKDKTPRLYRKVRRLSWAAASSILMLEFAFRPLVSDMRGLSRLLRHVVEETRRLKAWEGRIVRSHYRTEMTQSEATEASRLVDNGYANWQRTRKVSWKPAEYHATMYHRYTYGDFTRKWMKLFGTFDALGINLSLQTVWDAIPFSFVIDWFARVGDWLGRYDLRAIQPTTTILGFVHSVKQERTVERYIYPLKAISPTLNRSVLIAREVQSSYQRKPYIPNITGPGILNMSGANLREVILGTSLLRAKFRP